MDVLTNLCNEMYLSGEVVARFDLAGQWGITMPPHSGIFHAIAEGECWVRLAPNGELFQASAGDLIIFPEGGAHDMVDAPASLSVPLQEALCGQIPDSLICPVGSGEPPCTFVCGVFHFRDGGYHAFRTLLPPVLHVRGSQGETSQWLQMTLNRLCEESDATSPGAYTIISRLTDVLFIEGIRTWLSSQPSEGAGWFGALNDPVVGEPLGLIHGDPGRQWTIASLATEIGLSRSAFAAHFTRLVGEPPLKYITSWRMQLARNWLRGTNMGLSEIVDRLGYSSEDAFKRAFKREVGIPPGTYRREDNPGQLAA
jgi:AraC-like DNA-binding protein